MARSTTVGSLAVLLSILLACSGDDSARQRAKAGSSACGGNAGSSAGGGDAGSSACGGGGPNALNVLFIGNSYTYVNDLPGVLSRIAATAGTAPSIATAEVVQGGATLQEHWTNGLAQARINERQWTHVVLQGQSSEPLPTSYANFAGYAQQFEDLIVDAGARPTLFVTWAYAAGLPDYGQPSFVDYLFGPAEMQDELTAAYASLSGPPPGGLLACAGEAFRRSLAQYPEIVLQQSDFSHPTLAGTYLAACTFYVALTGHPVPPESEVPVGVSAPDAEHLREIAQVGSRCADVRPKGAVVWGDRPQVLTFPGPDGVFQFGPPFEYGIAGTSIPNYFFLNNVGEGAAGIEDGMTLSAPFAWSDGASYPGGSGTVSLKGTSYDFCSSALAPHATCVLAVSYAGATTGSGLLTLNLTNAYWPGITRELHGTATTRALVTVSEDAGYVGCTDVACGPFTTFVSLGVATPFSLLVTNRGSAPTTSLDVGTPLDAPFYWGPLGDAEAFPGGSGAGVVDGKSYDYCTKQTLGVGQQCLVTLSVLPTVDSAPFDSAVNLAYSDAIGTVSPNANRGIEGKLPAPGPTPAPP